MLAMGMDDGSVAILGMGTVVETPVIPSRQFMGGGSGGGGGPPQTTIEEVEDFAAERDLEERRQQWAEETAAMVAARIAEIREGRARKESSEQRMRTWIGDVVRRSLEKAMQGMVEKEIDRRHDRSRVDEKKDET